MINFSDEILRKRDVVLFFPHKINIYLRQSMPIEKNTDDFELN